MPRRQRRSRWVERPDVLDYICVSYVGVERGRRVFIWTDEKGTTWEGNIEAFTLHCASRFELLLEAVDAKQVHQVLRDMGAPARQYTEHRVATGEDVGKYEQPEPEQWILHGPDDDVINPAEG